MDNSPAHINVDGLRFGSYPQQINGSDPLLKAFISLFQSFGAVRQGVGLADRQKRALNAFYAVF